MSIGINSSGEYKLDSILDAREDPEGFCFGEIDEEKYLFVEGEVNLRRPAREKALGYLIQPAE